MGLFSKKNESENTISKEILDAIHISTLDYVPGYKVVKAFGMVGDLVKEEITKIMGIEGIKISSIGFVSSSGFEQPREKRITGEELYRL